MACKQEHEHSTDCEHEALNEPEFTLYTQIDLDSVRCLNAANEMNCSKIFKNHASRFDTTISLSSDCDEQLLIFIPFISSVKLKSIAVWPAPNDTAPSHMKAFINREDMDFSAAESTKPIQQWDLVERCPPNTIPEYKTKLTNFQNVRNLTLFFDMNFGGDVTTIFYIGLKGEYATVNQDPIITVYELAANPADHKSVASEMGSSTFVRDSK